MDSPLQPARTAESDFQGKRRSIRSVLHYIKRQCSVRARQQAAQTWQNMKENNSLMSNIPDSFSELLDQSLPLGTLEQSARRRMLTSYVVRLKVNIANFGIVTLSGNVDAS